MARPYRGRKQPPGQVRQPIQVYLTASERDRLDELARALGVSRAEVLRLGIASLERHEARSFHQAFDLLVGRFAAEAPADLAQRHDDYLARDIEARTAKSLRRSS